MKKSETKLKLDKDRLDSMSHDEIENYRMDFITNNDWSNKSLDKINRKYLDELSVYDDVRFKSYKFDMYDRWCKNFHDNEKKGIKDEALELPVNILEREDGYDLMYYLGLTHDIKKVGEFEFITGIDFNIPAKYKEMFKFEL